MTTRELSSSPSTLPLFARAALPLVPGLSSVPVVGPKLIGAKGGKSPVLPDLELVLREVAVDRGHLAKYNEVCGFSAGDTLPATYPFALAFPLHMALMTDPSFPFAAVGMVHLANRITQARPIGVDEKLSFRVFTTGLEPHAKGRQFQLMTEGKVGAEPVWECVSTILRPGGGDRSVSGPKPGAPAELPVMAEWTVPADIGRRYAAAAGDRNPIHLYDVTAKLLGFPRAIAHGMWTKAHALAALEDRLPKAYTVEVEFKRPVLLPARVTFGAVNEEGGVIRFGLCSAKDGKPHLDGTITPS
jgi:hypothetical protein